MTKLLCPTRGGEESYKNQDAAIALAKEKGCDILFLYVANIDFLLYRRSHRTMDFVQDNMDEMGEFLLTMAQERAEKENIAAITTVKHGIFSNVLLETITEEEICALFLGSAVGTRGHTTPKYMQNLVSLIQEKTGLEIFIANSGEIIENHAASQQPPDAEPMGNEE
jgi:hypothetical protein